VITFFLFFCEFDAPSGLFLYDGGKGRLGCRVGVRVEMGMGMGVWRNVKYLDLRDFIVSIRSIIIYSIFHMCTGLVESVVSLAIATEH
jgi:hypothetical protein